MSFKTTITWPPSEERQIEIQAAMLKNADEFLSDTAELFRRHFGQELPFVMVVSSMSMHHTLTSVGNVGLRVHLLKEGLMREFGIQGETDD